MSRPSDMPPAERFNHGTRARYTSGCRCEDCRRANREYNHARTKAVIFHGANGLVSAEPARLHILALSKHGCGRRAVADACDVGNTTISEIRTGRKLQIRRSTEIRILAVTADAALDHAVISARSTTRQIDKLLREGFTKSELARRLGYKTGALQINRRKVLAKNAARVDRFYRQIMAGDEEAA